MEEVPSYYLALQRDLCRPLTRVVFCPSPTWHQGDPSRLNAADLSEWLPLVTSTLCGMCGRAATLKAEP